MSNSNSAWNAIMQYSFLRIFANDDTIDADEMTMLKRLALGDGVVDDKERAALSRIFARTDAATLAPDVREDIARFKARHNID